MEEYNETLGGTYTSLLLTFTLWELQHRYKVVTQFTHKLTQQTLSALTETLRHVASAGFKHLSRPHF